MMRRVIVFFLCSIGPLLAQGADWRFIHPDAKAFIGFKLRRLRQSQIGAAIRTQMQAEDFPDLSALPGMDLVDKIDEVLISSPGRPDGAEENAQAPVLIRVSGDFDANRVESFLARTGAKLQKYRQYRVFRHKGDGDMAASLVDPHTLLLGDAPSLFAALERLEWTDAPNNPLLPRAVELQSVYDVWVLFAVPPSSFSSVKIPQLAALDSLRGLEAAVSMADGMVLRLGLNTDSPQEAAKLAGELKQLLLKTVKDHGAEMDIASLAKSIHFDVEDASVRLQLKVSAEELKKGLAQAQHRFAQKRAEMAQLRHSQQVPEATPAPAPEPQRQRVIRIEGLDDGPREIPYNR